MARKYHNLSGLVRDLEHAVEAGGTAEWDLLSRLENMLLAIEEEAPSEEGDESDSPDMEGELADDEDDHHRPDESSRQLELPGSRGLATDVPRGTSQRKSGPLPLVGTPQYVSVPPTFSAKGDKRRGT